MSHHAPTPHIDDIALAELRLCRVTAGERVAVLSEGDVRADYARAFLAAAEELGAQAFHVRLPRAGGNVTNEAGIWTVGATGLAGNSAAVEALKQADLVVDLVFLLFSDEQDEIQRSGTRIITCVEPVESLARLFPTEDQRRRCEVAGELLASAGQLRFSNAAGTDVTYRLGALTPMIEYGYVDEPARWDHIPSGFAFTAAHDDGVDGRVVVAPGDIVFPFKVYVRDPIELTIERGRIVSIAGGVEADLMADYMAGFGDPDAYGISHIGWGLNERARWSSLATDARGLGMESRAFYGNVLFSTGPNNELGGTNHSPCHLDIPMRGCSLWLDGTPILLDGDVVFDAMRAPAAGALA